LRTNGPESIVQLMVEENVEVEVEVEVYIDGRE
jgi:hypothetical protein